MKKFYLISLISLIISLISSCNKEEPAPSPKEENIQTSILLYAVASNNLASSFYDDMNELKEGLKKCNLSEVDFYVYYIASKSGDAAPTLNKAELNDQGEIEFRKIKEYDRSLYSTSPDRISSVIKDYCRYSSAPTRGLIMWSHSSAWAPSPNPEVRSGGPNYTRNNSISSDASLNADEKESVGELFNFGSFTPSIAKWWGMDTNNGVTGYCNLTDLSAAIPDDTFNFIWFDCCYMSSIEVIYQLKGKANQIVAYPTEVLAEGAPYDIVPQYIASKSPDVLGAAKAMTDYYQKGSKTFTIAVINPSAIERVAESVAPIALLEPLPARKLLKYSRGGYDFYDFGDFINSKIEQNDFKEWDAEAFKAAMNDLIIFKSSSAFGFNGYEIKEEQFSGISTGYVTDVLEMFKSTDEDDMMYCSLDWFKRIYQPYIR